MQFNIQEILDRFSQKARVLVLLILVVAISGTWIFNSYVNSGSLKCGKIIEENFALHEDLAKMSRLARELQQIKIAEEKRKSVAQRYIENSNSMYEVDPDSVVTPSEPYDPEKAILNQMMDLAK